MYHLTLRQLRVFEAVASRLSFSRAAESLHLTQPAVSMQIRQLEENIGLPLFEQMGKRIFLTEAGREMSHYSRTIAQQLLEAEAVLDELKGLERGKLTISVVGTANYFAPQLLAKFCKRYTGITISLNVANRESVSKQLEDNSTDLAIMGRPPVGMDIYAETFLANPLVVIATPDHPLANQRKIPLERLRGLTFIMREQGSGTRAAMEGFFQEHDIDFAVGTEMSTNEAIKQAVQVGMGLSVLSLHTVELELETRRLAVLDVEGFPIVRAWHLMHRANKRVSGSARAFKEFLLSEAANLVPAKIPAPRKRRAPKIPTEGRVAR
ncbi:MAG: LysR family transcriptional regulator [Burkholderiales bacterium]|nr:LysR family transcriptional regulator [Burkholderiales bacterium]